MMNQRSTEGTGNTDDVAKPTPLDVPEPVFDLPLDAICQGCGYSLHRLTGPRCPECGLAFDPAVYRNTFVAKWRGYMVYGLAHTNWRWVMGHQVS